MKSRGSGGGTVPTLSKDEFLKAHYEIRLLPDEDEKDPGYLATCPQLSGLTGYGRTPAAAIKDFEKNRSEWYDVAVEFDVAVPAPVGPADQRFSGKFMLRITPELHQLLTERAEAEGTSLNAFCQRVLKKRVLTSR